MGEIARKMADDGMLSRENLAGYIFPVYCRSQREATAPMLSGGALADIFTVV